MFYFLNIISFNAILLLFHKHGSCAFYDYQNTFLYKNDIHQHHVFTEGKTDLLHLHLSNSPPHCEDNSKGNFFPCWLLLLTINVGNLIEPIGSTVYTSFDYFAVYFNPRNFSSQKKIGKSMTTWKLRTFTELQI